MHVLVQAIQLLDQDEVSSAAKGNLGEWETVLRAVLNDRAFTKKRINWSAIQETALRSAAETASASVAKIQSILEQLGASATPAKSLHAIAKWWSEVFDEASADEVVAAFAERSIDDWRERLRGIAGVNWELADRILLFAGNLPAMPLGRSLMRVVARHGWQETTAEYEEWQSFFRSASTNDGVDLAHLSHSLQYIGKKYCGRVPRCDECPLRALLPAAGPISLTNEMD